LVLPVTPEAAGSSPVRPAEISTSCPADGQFVGQNESDTSGDERTETQLDLVGVVETALARALMLAAEAGRWEIVERITAEIRARREARGDVDSKNRSRIAR
jgi:hypothetical protein